MTLVSPERYAWAMNTPDSSARPGLTTAVRVLAFEGERSREVSDELATEEPLEIRLVAGGQTAVAALTMRTPGADFELAAGFLFNEGVIRGRSEIAEISYCIDPIVDREQRYNIVNVTLARPKLPDLQRLERHFSAGSACGVCGKASIEALEVRAAPLEVTTHISLDVLRVLPNCMREHQRIFSATGGLHAAALFESDGTLAVLREDVGRHNALDKIIGWALLNDALPLSGRVAAVSGRASYELVQKCIVAGIEVLSAVSAPSSLAVQLALAFNVTLAGFVRGERANVYSVPVRIE